MMQQWIAACSLALVFGAPVAERDDPRVVLWWTSSFARRTQRPVWTYVTPRTYGTEAQCYAAGAALAEAETKRGWTGLKVMGLSVYSYNNPRPTSSPVPVFEARCLPVGVTPQ
jgi:hypothetical protein